VVVVEKADSVKVVHPMVHLAVGRQCSVLRKLQCRISGASLCCKLVLNSVVCPVHGLFDEDSVHLGFRPLVVEATMRDLLDTMALAQQGMDHLDMVDSDTAGFDMDLVAGTVDFDMDLVAGTVDFDTDLVEGMVQDMVDSDMDLVGGMVDSDMDLLEGTVDLDMDPVEGQADLDMDPVEGKVD
jgi:hypothetical protein